MKRFLAKLISIILLLTVCFSMVACGEPDGNVGSLDAFSIRKDATNPSKPLMLVEKGATKYKIVYPENATKADNTAVSELTLFLKESFGVKFDSISDKNASLDTNNYYISIGETKLIQALDGTENEVERPFDLLKQNGFVIANRGNVIYICGANNAGTLNGTYTFLEKQVNFEQFAWDEIYVDKLDSKEVYDYGTYQYTPNVQYLVITGGALGSQEQISSYRQRMAFDASGGTDIDGGIYGMGYAHTIPSYYNGENEFAWCCPDGTHFCLTNLGKDFDDPEGPFEAVANDVVAKLENAQQTGAKPVIMKLGMNDDMGRCNCENCNAFYDDTHLDSQGYLNLLNHVGKRLREYCAENGIERKIYAQGLMYNLYETPPVSYDETTGTYVPLNEDVYVDENVMVRWAPIFSCFSHAWNDPNCAHNSKTYYHNIEGWATLTENLSLWTYGIYFQGDGGMLMFPDVGSIKGQADYFEEHPFFLTRWETNLSDDDGTFYELKDYLRGKLFYDNSYDFDALFNKFFDHYYKAAAPAMKLYYNLTLANFNAISDKKGWGNCIDCYYNVFIYHEPEDWPYEVLLGLENAINMAYDAIEKGNYDSETKQKLIDRVASDGLMYKHFMLANCDGYFSDAELSEMIRVYKEECSKYKITNYANV